MNGQEYERGELITDWNNVQPNSILFSEQCPEKKYTFIRLWEKKPLIYCREIDEFNTYSPDVWKFYYAIPKKEKVVKYQFQFIDVNGKIDFSDDWYRDGEDFLSDFSEGIKPRVYIKLDWTAKEFDE